MLVFTLALIKEAPFFSVCIFLSSKYGHRKVEEGKRVEEIRVSPGRRGGKFNGIDKQSPC